MNGVHGLLPLPLLQGGQVSIVHRNGLRRRLPSDPCDCTEILLGRHEIPHGRFEQPQPIEQGRHAPPFFFRKCPKPSHQRTHQAPLALGRDRQAIAGPEFAPGEAMLFQRPQDRLTQLPQLLPLAFQFRLNIEDIAVRVADCGSGAAEFFQALVETVPVLSQDIGQGGEPGFLALFEPFELGEGQPLKQLVIGFHMAAEEIVHGAGQQRRLFRGFQSHEPAQGGVAEFDQFHRDLAHHLALGVN